MARLKFPDYRERCGLCGVDDDLGDGLVLLIGDQHHLFEQVFGVIALDESNDVGRVSFWIEIAYRHAGALALMRVLPELPISGGKVEGRQNLPMILLDS